MASRINDHSALTRSSRHATNQEADDCFVYLPVECEEHLDVELEVESVFEIHEVVPLHRS